MAIYLEMLHLSPEFPFRLLVNEGDILTTPHWHREIELIYVIKGTINLGINDQPYIVSAGEIVLIDGGELHYVLASPGSERIIYQFDLAFFKTTMAQVDLPVLFSELPTLSRDWGAAVTDIRRLLDQIYQEETNQLPAMTFEVRADIYKILTRFIREVPRTKVKTAASQQVKSDEILARLDIVFRMVEKRYTGHLSLEEVAAEIGYSQFYFTRFFKRNTGKTFITFLNDYRIDKAKWLLINSTLSVTEIISQVGFESDKTFYRLFKQSMAISPLAYRKQMRLDKE
ncbi:AraC family transcriptional regulator [Latilactobacillus sakei]|uniref:AraC family transcriptional regulator n=1 Tax=Latilactobacillus sakei TaxID=1599 RepID=UPI000DCADEF1|nr:AraC family transcriptional regulator [Latilactobacillus sakei]AWZ44911.1 AraC family transcriptional regulator [Latilactobacillus sakei]MCE8501513.1 helix-turn-helix domain-containing protein [Latilactobacillus sakei]